MGKGLFVRLQAHLLPGTATQPAAASFSSACVDLCGKGEEEGKVRVSVLLGRESACCRFLVLIAQSVAWIGNAIGVL